MQAKNGTSRATLTEHMERETTEFDSVSMKQIRFRAKPVSPQFAFGNLDFLIDIRIEV